MEEKVDVFDRACAGTEIDANDVEFAIGTETECADDWGRVSERGTEMVDEGCAAKGGLTMGILLTPKKLSCEYFLRIVWYLGFLSAANT
jgi:hypothetical protein